MIKAIIYDKDGTLMRFDAFWVPIARSAIRQIVSGEVTSDDVSEIDGIAEEIEREIGVNGDTADTCGILCGGTYTQFAAVISETMKKHGFDAPTDRYAVEKALLAHIDEGKVLPPRENLREKLLVAKRTAKLFVVTTDDRAITEVCLEKLGIADLFDDIYCDDGKTPHKPDPFAALDIAAKFGLDKSEIFMIGDTATDRNFAHNAGIYFAFVGGNAEIAEKCMYKAKNVCDATDMILAYGERK